MTDSKATRQSTRLQDLTGQRFGRLVVISRMENSEKDDRVQWMCRCDCGNEIVAKAIMLRQGKKTSCNCFQRERSSLRLSARMKTHGLSKTTQYNIWSGMNKRCHNPRTACYHNYGGRGIAVCAGWRGSFENFLADVGEPPTSSHSIDRINNDRGYECGKCDECKARGLVPNWRWATQQEQCNNTRHNRYLTHNGETMTVAQWARRLNVSYNTLIKRIYHGWSDEDIFSRPFHKQG